MKQSSLTSFFHVNKKKTSVVDCSSSASSSDWVESFSKTDNTMYWVNKKTGERQWETPLPVSTKKNGSNKNGQKASKRNGDITDVLALHHAEVNFLSYACTKKEETIFNNYLVSSADPVKDGFSSCDPVQITGSDELLQPSVEQYVSDKHRVKSEEMSTACDEGISTTLVAPIRTCDNSIAPFLLLPQTALDDDASTRPRDMPSSAGNGTSHNNNNNNNGNEQADTSIFTNTTTVPELSEYEQRRLENIRRNSEFLAQIGLVSAVVDIAGMTNTGVSVKRRSEKKRQRWQDKSEAKATIAAVPERQSARIRAAPAVNYDLEQQDPSLTAAVASKRKRGQEEEEENEVEEEEEEEEEVPALYEDLDLFAQYGLPPLRQCGDENDGSMNNGRSCDTNGAIAWAGAAMEKKLQQQPLRVCGLKFEASSLVSGEIPHFDTCCAENGSLPRALLSTSCSSETTATDQNDTCNELDMYNMLEAIYSMELHPKIPTLLLAAGKGGRVALYRYSKHASSGDHSSETEAGTGASEHAAHHWRMALNFRGHDRWISSAKFIRQPDSSSGTETRESLKILTASDDASLKLWDLGKRQIIESSSSSAPSLSCTSSSSAKRDPSSRQQKVILTAPQIICTARNIHQKGIFAMDVHYDYFRVLTGSKDKTVVVSQLADSSSSPSCLQKQQTYCFHTGVVKSVCWQQSGYDENGACGGAGNVFASGGQDRNVFVKDIRCNNVDVPDFSLGDSHSTGVHTVKWGPIDEQLLPLQSGAGGLYEYMLCTASMDGSVRIFDVRYTAKPRIFESSSSDDNNQNAYVDDEAAPLTVVRRDPGPLFTVFSPISNFIKQSGAGRQGIKRNISAKSSSSILPPCFLDAYTIAVPWQGLDKLSVYCVRTGRVLSRLELPGGCIPNCVAVPKQQRWSSTSTSSCRGTHYDSNFSRAVIACMPGPIMFTPQIVRCPLESVVST